MKSIIARFTELKENVAGTDASAFDDLDYNKVDTALKSVGVSLVDTNGQFRDLDDVFLDLSAKWQSLDRNSQRYIATIAAGSRQQSRFISMMQNYERTMELIEVANDSAGKSSEQFAKYQDTIEYKLKQLSNSWEQLRVGFFSSDTYGKAIEGLTGILNKIQEFDAIDFVALGGVWLLFGKTIIMNIIKGVESGSKAVQSSIGRIVENIRGRIPAIINSTINIQARKEEAEQKIRELQEEIARIDREIESNSIKINVDITDATNKVEAYERRLEELRAQYNNTLSEDDLHQEALRDTGLNDSDLEQSRQQIEQRNNAIEQERNLNNTRRNTEQQLNNQQEIMNDILGNEEELRAEANARGEIAGTVFATTFTAAITAVAAAENPAEAFGTVLISGITALIPSLVSVVTTAGLSMSAAFSATGIGLAITLALAAAATIITTIKKSIENSKIDKLQEKYDTLTKEVEELQKEANEKIETSISSKEEAKSIKELQEEFEKLNSKQVLTVEEQEKYAELVDSIKDKYPEIITFYDETTGKLQVQNQLWEKMAEQSELVAKNDAKIALKSQLELYDKETQQIKADIDLQKDRLDDSTVLKQTEKGTNLYEIATSAKTEDNFVESFLVQMGTSDTDSLWSPLQKYAKETFGYTAEQLNETEKLEEVLNSIIENGEKETQILADLNLGLEKQLKLRNEIAESQTQSFVAQTLQTTLELDEDYTMANFLAKYGTQEIQMDDYKDADGELNIDEYSEKLLETAETAYSNLDKTERKRLSSFLMGIPEMSKEDMEKARENIENIPEEFRLAYLQEVSAFKQEWDASFSKLKFYLPDIDENSFEKLDKQLIDNFILSIQNIPEDSREAYAEAISKLFKDYSIDDQEFLFSLDLSTLDITNRDNFIEQIIENTSLSEEQAEEFLNLNKEYSDGWIPTTLGALEEMYGKLKEANEEIRSMNGDLKSFAKEMVEVGSISLDTVNKLRDMGMDDAIVMSIKGYELDIEKMYSSYYDSLAERRNSTEQIYTLSLNELNSNQLTNYLEYVKADKDYVVAIAESIEGANEGIEEAEKAVEDAKKAYDDVIEKLADLEQAYWDAVKAQQEALYGSEDFQSSLDGLINYTSKIEELNRTIEKTKEALEDVSDIGQATNLVSQLDSDYQNKSVALGAENRAIDDALANLQSVMLSNYSDFISFDENGLATVDFSYVDMNVNDELRKAFEEEYNTYEEYRKKKQENIDELEAIEKERNEFYKQSLDDFVGVQEGLISILKDQAQEEIDVQKDKYAALEEADNNYIEALEEAINKQRELRDKESKYEDLATKEKKLSLMSRDTSGANQKEVQSLEKEIENDRQEVLDSEIDNIINSMKELYEKQKEARDAEIEYMEEVSENTQNFAEWANNIMSTWTSLEDMQGWYLENNPEVENMTPEQVEAYMNELEENYTTYAQYMALKAIDFTTDQEALNNAINDMYLHTETNISDIGNTIQSTAQDAANAAIEEANRAVADAKKAWDEGKQDALDAYEEWKTKEKELEDARINSINMTKAAINSLVTSAQTGTVAAAQTAVNTLLNLGFSRDDLINQHNLDAELVDATINGTEYSKGVALYIGGARYGVYDSWEDAQFELNKMRATLTSWEDARRLADAEILPAYKQGGLVDYTGPAWVDGTKTNPEAFLSAQDTERIGMAARILSDLPIFNSTKSSENAVASNIGDTSIEIHINVENIASDYDVDQMIERVKKDIVDVSKPIGTSVILRK